MLCEATLNVAWLEAADFVSANELVNFSKCYNISNWNF